MTYTGMTYKGVRFRQDALDMIRNKPSELFRIMSEIDRREQCDLINLPWLYVRAGGTMLLIDDE